MTRARFDSIQGDPDRPEAAAMDDEWEAACAAYRAHLAEIRSKLPRSAKVLAEATFHDGVIEEVDHADPSVLILTIDATNNPWGPQGRFRIRFSGVKLVEGGEDLIGNDWLYEEVHLHRDAGFELRVLLSGADLRIVADDVEFETLKDEF